MRLQVIPITQIIPDPDVQFDFAYNEKLVRLIAAHWDERLAGVIDVVPWNNNMFAAFVGRHRLKAAALSGQKTLRCDVWDEDMTVAEKHQIKLGKDRDRRNVKLIEVFLGEIGAGEPDACAIKRICEECGYEVGKLSGGKPYNRIEAVLTLRQCYRRSGDHLRRTLIFNTLWKDDPKSNSSNWLGGLSLAVAEGWTDRISSSGYARLKEIIPAKVIREAVANATVTNPAAGELGILSKLICARLRKTARVQVERDKP